MQACEIMVMFLSVIGLLHNAKKIRSLGMLLPSR
jgi:hypothetical protein